MNVLVIWLNTRFKIFCFQCFQWFYGSHAHIFKEINLELHTKFAELLIQLLILCNSYNSVQKSSSAFFYSQSFDKIWHFNIYWSNTIEKENMIYIQVACKKFMSFFFFFFWIDFISSTGLSIYVRNGHTLFSVVGLLSTISQTNRRGN